MMVLILELNIRRETLKIFAKFLLNILRFFLLFSSDVLLSREVFCLFLHIMLAETSSQPDEQNTEQSE